LKDALLFLKQTANHWRTTGAFAPSGPVLARAIADQIGPVADGQVVVELGPGTGVVTRELVHRFPRSQVVAVEVLEAFAPRLAEVCPGATVVTGCASELEAHLDKLGIAPESVAAVISGLPLLVLPEELGRRVVESAAAVLRPGRRYVQFSYSGRRWRRRALPGFRRLGSRRIWLNFPPAVVLTFEREG
jgi:phosphatidylethanolamine/phosphatidyl-N-methylethanolamine N-methyltransferase